MKKTSKKDKIGIFDSGLGGLSVWSEIVRLIPNNTTLYYADAANCPYGNKGTDEIFNLTLSGVKWLLSHGAGVIVIACNTATGAAISRLREMYPDLPIVGLEPAIKKAVERTANGIVGIMATKYTLGSKKYKTTKEKYAGSCTVIEQAGDGLVEQVENGEEESPKTYELLKKYILPMIGQGADTLVLGCTHYPLLMKQIRKIAENKLDIIDAAPFVAKHVKEIIDSNKLNINGPTHYVFHSTISGSHSKYIRKKALSYVNSNK